jgi:hypothetical protein
MCVFSFQKQDVDIALGLLMASTKWSGSYRADATNLITNIMNHEVFSPSLSSHRPLQFIFFFLKYVDPSTRWAPWSERTAPHLLTAHYYYWC